MIKEWIVSFVVFLGTVILCYVFKYLWDKKTILADILLVIILLIIGTIIWHLILFDFTGLNIGEIWEKLK